jgi:hypothetical protein
VKLLYRGVLKRLEDGPGLQTHSHTLGKRPHFDDALNMLEAFVNSEESQALKVLRAMDKTQIIHQDHHEYSDKPVDNVMSIGSHCAASYMLKGWGLKKQSVPFDWIFSSLGMVSDCIEDDFEKFLDQSYYEPIPDHYRLAMDVNFCNHTYFRDRYGIGAIFNHADPNIAENYEYLKRCADRFRRILKSDSRNILFAVAKPGFGGIEDFERLIQVVRHHSGIEILAVMLSPKVNYPEISLKRLIKHGRHQLYEFQSMSEIGPVGFPSPLDEIMLKTLVEEQFPRVGR